MKRIAFIFNLLFVISSSFLFAHDMYMWPHFQSKNEAELRMMVEKEEVVWFESMTAGLRMEGPSGEADLSIPDQGDPSLQFKVPGTYVIGWESEPIFLKVEPEIFEKYIRIEGYMEASDLRTKTNRQKEPGREYYTRFIKTYIQVGPRVSDDFKRPFGYRIEILPMQNPCSLMVGSEFDVLVLYNGKPYANRKIMATYDSYSNLPEDYAQVTMTDAEGIAKFRITHKGLWLVRTNAMESLEGNRDADWQSFWANVTFEVK